MTLATPDQVQLTLDPGITPAGAGIADVAWNILGHVYYPKAESASTFAFETMDPAGTYVPVHTHTSQDEFIFVLENEFDLYLDGGHRKARAGDLVRMPAGIPHGYYNLTDATTRALFWVSPSRMLRELFDTLHNMTDPLEVIRESAKRDVIFMKPEDYAFDPLSLKAG